MNKLNSFFRQVLCISVLSINWKFYQLVKVLLFQGFHTLLRCLADTYSPELRD